LFVLLRDKNLELMDNYLTNRARAVTKQTCACSKLLNDWKINPAGKTWADF
jgi:hypothetical protein